MPVSDPRQCRDRNLEWSQYFYKRRGEEILAMLTDDIVAEHARNADERLGPHSATLHTVLNYFRAKPIIGKEFVYAVKPYAEYRLGTVTERGMPAQVLDGPVVKTEKEAMHEVFLVRVTRLRNLVGSNG